MANKLFEEGIRTEQERILILVKAKRNEFEEWMVEFPQKDGTYLVAEGCVKALGELESKIQEKPK